MIEEVSMKQKQDVLCSSCQLQFICMVASINPKPKGDYCGNFTRESIDRERQAERFACQSPRLEKHNPS